MTSAMEMRFLLGSGVVALGLDKCHERRKNWWNGAGKTSIIYRSKKRQQNPLISRDAFLQGLRIHLVRLRLCELVSRRGKWQLGA